MKVTAGSSVVEAASVNANFVISTEVSPNSIISVRYDLAESSDFIANEGTGKTANLNFSNNVKEVTLPIAITPDDAAEDNGTITVTLIADTSPVEYLVAPAPDNSAQVNVFDDDSTPTIEIAADSGNVAESAGTAQFKLTATGLDSSDTLTINATPDEDGSDFLTDAVADTAADFMVEFTDPNGDNIYTGELPITLYDDEDEEPTGDIKLTLNLDTMQTATYRLGSTTEGVITIFDDDAPELKITAGDSVVEAASATANFVISAEVSPNTSVNVRYDLAETQNFIDNEGQGKVTRADFSNDVKEVSLPITIANDTTIEDNGTITITLAADTADPITYTVAASPNNSATINVIDDDSLPTISISADSGDVAESQGNALFMLTTTDLTSATTITINATPTEESGNFLANTFEGTALDYPVLFTDFDGDGTYNGEFSVPLDNDDIGEVTSDIKLTLNANSLTFNVGSTTEGIITVWDDDAPELEITAGESVIEGDNVFANFVVSAEVSPNDNVLVRYDLAESHSFIANEGTGKTSLLDFSNGATEATLPIAITNDDEIERAGTITITLTADTADPITYTLATSPNNTASVNAIDDDSLPIVSIAVDSGEVIENNGTAQFMLTATGLIESTTVEINATPTEFAGDFLTDAIADTATEYTVEFTDPDGDGTYNGEISVPLHNDTVGERTGGIKLTLNEDPDITDTYMRGPTTEGVVTIFDDDAPELRISAGTPQTEAAGVFANFVISAKVSPNKSIDVRYDLGDTSNFIDNEGTDKTASLNFSNLATEVTLPIAIVNDNTAEDNGSVYVTLTADNADTINYTTAFSPNNAAEVFIYDDDSPPTITINADAGNVLESQGSVPFELSATGLTATTTLTISATPSESGSSFLTTGASGTATDFTVEFSDPDGDSTYNGELSLPLDNDSTGEATGNITLTLNTSPQVYRLGSTTQSVVNVWDDDAPELMVTSIASVTEGVDANADFVISTRFSPNRMINIQYNLVDDLNSINGDGLGKTSMLDFTNGATQATLSFAIIDDSNVGYDGAVTFTLLNDNSNPVTYMVAPAPNNATLIHIQDDDDLPWVSVAESSRNIMMQEGMVNVDLSATDLPSTTTLSINATFTEVGSNFLREGISGIAKDYDIEFSDSDGNGTYSGIINVPILIDTIGESTGNIQLTLNADPDLVDTYRLTSS